MSHDLTTQDQLDIQYLLARAGSALDAHAMDELGILFAGNASFSLRIARGDLMGPFEGRSAIIDMMTDAVSQQTDQRRHVISNVFFGGRDEDGAVEVTSNLTLLATEDGAIRLLSAGVYHDRVIRSDAGWQLLARHLELDTAY